MSIKTPKSRKEMEHNVNLLREQGVQAIKSENEEELNRYVVMTWTHLKEVVDLPNGRIYLPTINEQTRLQGNMQDTDLTKFQRFKETDNS